MRYLSLLISAAALVVASQQDIPNKPAPAIGASTSGIPPPCTEAEVIITNSGFEDGSLQGWQSFQQAPNNSVSIVSPGHNSNYAVKLSMPTWSVYQGGPALWQMQIPVCEVILYQLSFDYKIIGSSRDGNIQTYVLREDPPQQQPNPTKGDSFQYPFIPLKESDWATASYNVSVGTYRNVSLSIGLAQQFNTSATPGVSVLLDNIALVPIANTEAADCPRTDISIANGGFEKGSLDPWTFYRKQANISAAVVSPGYNSKHMLQIALRSPSTVIDTIRILQPIYNQCVGYNYTYTFDYEFTNIPDTLYNQSAYLTVYYPGCYFYGGDHPRSNNVANYYPVSGWNHVRFFCQQRLYADNYFDFLLIVNRSVQGIDNTAIPPFELRLDNIGVKAAPIIPYVQI